MTAGRLLLVLAAATLAVRAGRAAAAEPPAPAVVEVRVEGLVTIPPETVLKAMATRKGLPFHPATYREDYERIHALGLFEPEDIVLHAPEPVEGGVRVRVTCRERPVIERLELAGNREYRSRTILDAVRKEAGEEGRGASEVVPAAGERYARYKAFFLAEAVRRFYLRKGYSQAQVAPRPEPVAGRPGRVTARLEIQEGPYVYIAAVDFQGRSAFPARELRSVIETRPRPSGVFCWLYHRRKLDPDVQRTDAIRLESFYHNRGHSDARVEALPPRVELSADGRRGRLTAVFEVREGRRYSYGPVTFAGLASAGRDEALRAAGLEPGRPYSEQEVAAACRRIGFLLGERARPFARVEAQRGAADAAGATPLEFRVQEGPEAVVGPQVRIRGNAMTRDRIIRRELEIFPGDLYDSRKVRATERNLRRLGLFEAVSIEEVRGEEPGVVDLEIEVKEVETTAGIFAGLMVDQEGSIGGHVTFTERNFDWQNPPGSLEDILYGGAWRGGAQNLSVSTFAAEDTQRVRLDFENPWIWDTPERYNFGFGGFFMNRDYFDYHERRSGGDVRIGRRLFIPGLRGYFRYRLQNVYVDGVEEDMPEIFHLDEGWNLYSSGRVGLSFDTLDQRWVPSRGLLLEAGEEVFGGPFGGDHDLNQTSLEGNAYLTIFRTWDQPHVLHLRARGDLATPYGRNDYVPLSERYFAGGVGSVRGFDPRSISPLEDDERVGGDFRLTETAEYVWPLPGVGETLRGVFFFDAGAVWPDEGDFEWHDQRRSYGAGLHIKPPAMLGPMPIKLYFCFPVNPSPDDRTRLFDLSFSFLF